MKKIILLNFIFSLLLFGKFDPHLCATYMGNSVFSAEPQNNCVIDDKLERWMKCRTYFEQNMMNGLSYHGKKEVQGSPTFMYEYFDKEIKKVLLAEVKKQIAKSQGIMCIKNTEDDLFEYQMSIAEHEWCYAPKFLEAFNDGVMNEHEMKYGHFIKLYNIRSNMLESKEKPKNKGILCGVYLECMRSFISADHTAVSSGLSALYEKTKKECRTNYFTIDTKIERQENSRTDRGDNVMIDGPKSLISSWNTVKESKQIMYIDAANGNIRMSALEGDAHSSKRGSYHQFNSASCTYELKSKSSKDENLNYSMASLKNHNIGLVDDDKATIELQVRSSPFKKKFSIDWSTLQNSGSWSGHGSFNKSNNSDGLDDLDVPEGLEGLSGIANTVKNSIIAMRKELGPKSKEMTQKGIDNFARSQKEACHNKRVHEGFFVSEKKTTSLNIEVDISIQPATNYEISLMEKILDDEDIQSYSARRKPEKKVSSYEKESSSIFDMIQNSTYDNLDNKDKKAWDNADKEHKDAMQNKKDLEEFEELSIDDLEMFTK